MKLFKIGFIFTFLLTSLQGFSSNGHEFDWEHASESERKEKIKEEIDHHLDDDHNFTLLHGVSFPLPVILWDEGLKVFMSSAFESENGVAEAGGNYYTLYHGHVYKCDAHGHVAHDENGDATGKVLLDLSLTKNVIMILLMSGFIFFLFSRIAKSYKNSDLPQKGGKFLEPIVIFIRDEIAIPNIGEKHYKKYMSYLLTVFFFIWFLNLAGMLPFGISVTNNIAITFSLAIITFLITNLTANKNYWGHIFWMPGVPIPMRIILAPIELLGVFIKPFALMIRLFANMTAGHVVLMSIIGLIFAAQSWLAAGPVSILTLVLNILELLVAALQAYIFTMLTALYFGSANEEHHHEHAEHH